MTGSFGIRRMVRGHIRPKEDGDDKKRTSLRNGQSRFFSTLPMPFNHLKYVKLRK